MLKKVFSGLALAVVMAGAIWAQPQPIADQPKALGLQASPKSAVKAVTGRINLDEDNFLDVTGWTGVEFEKLYFFLGGATQTKAFQGGLATKIGGSNHLAFFFNGNFFSGNGTNNGADDDKNSEIRGQATWNDEFAVLFANEAIGGVRFDILFDNSVFTNEENGENANPTVKKTATNGPVVTSLQWGKKIGAVTPKVTLGFQWPKYTLTEPHSGDKTEKWENAKLGLKAEVAAGSFSGDYQLTLDFGTTTKSTIESTESGYYDNTLNLYYGLTANVGEKLQFKVRPQLQFRLSGAENKATTDGKTSYYGAPTTWFSFSPIVETGVKFQATERLSLFTGVKAALLTVTSKSEDSHKGDLSPEVKDKPSEWKVTGIQVGNFAAITNNYLEFAANFAFNPLVSVNFAFSTPLLSIGIPGDTGGNFSVGNPFTASSLISGARLVLNFKPGAGGEE
ncbi:MAG: hypothetical protein LBD20_07080 [Spirochaetaceae bacterium]|jgi:hypothetical protein|nr:hypothetical protein [Spirochaetaceae bacterium]